MRELDQQDISTHGLTFTIKTNRDILLFTTIVIEKGSETTSTPGERYNISYAKNFNPNNTVHHLYARNVKKELIPSLLIELSKLYFRQLNPEKEQVSELRKEAHVNGSITSYQCSNCLTVYDKKYGDPTSNIPVGVPFEDLPETYRCHVCDSMKKYFLPVKDY